MKKQIADWRVKVNKSSKLYNYHGPKPIGTAQKDILAYILYCLDEEIEDDEDVKVERCIGYAYNYILDNPREVPNWTNADVDVFKREHFVRKDYVKPKSTKVKIWLYVSKEANDKLESLQENKSDVIDRLIKEHL